MEASLNQLKQLAAESDDARREVVEALKALTFSLESPQDTIHRFGHMTLQGSTVQVGVNLGLFRCLVEHATPMTIEMVTAKTGGEPRLMTRLMRYLAAIGAVREVGKGEFTSNQTTQNLTQAVVEAGLSHYFYTAGPQYQSLPEFLERNGYKTPIDSTHTAFNLAFHTDMDSFTWFSKNPSHLAHFNAYMALRRDSGATWLSVYPVESEAEGWKAELPIYVNIGGGVGHQCAQFREKYPTLPGRVVLQDLLHSVAQALPTRGVENMAHNFFEEQPVTGAKFYYMRAVLHNHPPHKVRQILENIKAAMGPQSVLLIDEMVLPETSVSFIASSIDMTMLSALAGMERTEAMWRETFRDIGLELVHIYTYNISKYESVMDVRLPKSI